MYSQTIFPNGLKLITVPVKDAKTVTVLVLLPVGSRYETIHLNGVSHFIEHMMFKGTKKRLNSLAISKELDGIGAYYNAFTGKDHTGYWVKSAKEKIGISLDVLSDMLFNSVFDQKEFDNEKTVILEEIKMYEENPLFYIHEFFESTLFNKHALGQIISGHLSDVQKLSRQSLMKYKELFYQPNQMLIIVAGGIEKAQTIKLVKKYFASYQGRAKRIKYTPLVRKKGKPDIKIRFQKLKQTQLALGGFAYPYSHSRSEAATLLSTILGGNMSSRLFTQVRDKRGLAYSIKMGLGKYQDIGNYVIQAGVDTEKVLETIKVILDELNKVKKDFVTKEELARAKDYIGGIMKISLEDSADLATWYGYQFLFGNKILSPNQRLEKFKKVTQKQIKNVAQDIFCKQGLKLALIGPIKNKKSLLRILEKRI